MKNQRKTAIILAENNVSPSRANEIMSLYASDEEFFAYFAKDERCVQILGRTKFNEVRLISDYRSYNRLVEKYIRMGLGVITKFDEDYPFPAENENAPYVLYMRGSREIINRKAFAIIGTRRITSYGRQAAEFFASALTDAGLVLISGASEGVEYVAAKTALEARKDTILCLPNGLNAMSNFQRQLAKDYEHLLIISAVSPDTFQQGFSILNNNRLIAELASGVLIVEAGEKSGSETIVNNALELGKEVFAVPGEIFSPMSKCPNRLIREMKAEFVTSPQDILEKLNSEYRATATINSVERTEQILSEPEKQIIHAITAGSRKLNDIVEFTGMSVIEAGALLPLMELNGYIEKMGTGEYRIAAV